MIKKILTGFIFLLFSFTNIVLGATPIVVSISLNGTVVIPGTTKHVNVCKGSIFQLYASNISPTKPTTGAFYKWQNIDSVAMLPKPIQQFNASEGGRWVATISYFNSATSSFTMASDTIFVDYYPSQPFKITQSNGAPITTPTINICGTRDSMFKATPGFTNYNWYKGSYSDLVSTTSSLTITNTTLSAGEGVQAFFVTATDPNGCEGANDQQNFRRDISVNVELGKDTTVCVGTPVVLSSPSSLPPSILINYKWSTGATTTTYTATAPGKYKLMIINAGSKCSNYDSVNVFNNPIPVISITKDTTICLQTTVQLNAVVTVGTGPFTYKWNASSDLSSTTISNPIATPPATNGTYTYSVRATDPIGCSSSLSTVNVSVYTEFGHPYFKLDAGNDTLVCYQTENQLTPTIKDAAYAATYTWQWGPAIDITNTTSMNPTIALVSSNSQKYGVTATDNRGCKMKDSVLATNLPEVFVSTTFKDSTRCFLDTIVIVAKGSGGSSVVYTYNFTPAEAGTQLTNSFQVILLDTGYTINVIAKDTKGCSSKPDTIKLRTDKPEIQIASGKDTIAFGGQPLDIVATVTPAAATVNWYDLQTNTTVGSGKTYTSTKDESIYAVATNIHGCKNRDSLNIIHINANMYVLYIPNVFSPQASEVENQKLKVYGTRIQEDGFMFRIYNQWGQLVYQSTSFVEANTIGWTGDVKNNDGKQSTNVYTYTIEGKFYDGETFKKAGTSTMLF